MSRSVLLFQGFTVAWYIHVYKCLG
jgi:hypothetical protein